MKKYTLHLFTAMILFSLKSLAQDPKVYNAIVEEGKALYRSEMASWNGSDLFLEQLGHKRNNMGGYLSYSEGELTRCVFYDRAEPAQVIASYTFDATFSTKTVVTDTLPRSLNQEEAILFEIRKKTLDVIPGDSLFLYYKNTNYNLIPLHHNGERKVYILTAPQVNGLIILGNDYVLTFDEQNNLTEKRKIHNNILSYEIGEESSVGGMHSHLPSTGDYITATDICTLMLYARFAGWETHTVVGPNFTSLWNCTTNTMIVVNSESFGKTIEKEEKEKTKKRKTK